MFSGGIFGMGREDAGVAGPGAIAQGGV